jgi:predicted nucleic acid-binding protein
MPALFDLNEPIGLWELPLSPKDYDAACFRALSGEDVLVFIDTNVLSASFRLHQEAREGLFKLLRIPLAAKRLIVPAWVANEYVHNAFKASKTSHAFRESELDKLRASLPATKNLSAVLHQVASDRDMEKIARRLKVSPAQASQALNERVEQITSALRDAGGDLAIDAVHNELLTELRGAFIPNDLGLIAQLVADQAAYRRSSRIPPGLTDAAKGEASEGEDAAGNADGDLAIWLEILQLASARVCGHPNSADSRTLKSVLFVTQEKKEDFLYRPRKRLIDAVKGEGTEENKDIRLVDPRLVAEFEHRVGHRRIAFANLESIASGALAAIGDREFQDSVGMFIAAMRKQKRVAEAKTVSNGPAFSDPFGEKVQDSQQDEPLQIEIIEEDVAKNLPTAQTDQHTTRGEELVVPDDVLVECARVGAAPIVANHAQVIANLLSENKRTEDNAIQRLQLTGLPSSVESSFALGRAAYGASA